MIFAWIQDSDGWYTWNGNNSSQKPKFKIEGELLYKVNPIKLDSRWRSKMEKVLEIWIPPQFEFIESGYKMKYVPGHDLHGNKVFVYDNSLDYYCRYDNKYLPSIQKIYTILETINEKLGMTFADVSPSNIITDPTSDQTYLVDLDDIIPLTPDQLNVWNSNKELVFNKNIGIV